MSFLPQKPAWWQFWKQGEYRRKLISFRFLLLLLPLIGLTATLTVIKVSLELRDRAGETAQVVPMIMEIIFDPESQTVSIGRMATANYSRPLETHVSLPASLTLTTPTGVAQKTPFRWIDAIHSEDFAQLAQTTDPPPPSAFYIPPKTVAILSIDYVIGSTITVTHPQSGQEIALNTIGLKEHANERATAAVTTLPPPSVYQEPFLDIAFVGNGFTDMADFTQKASEITTFLSSIYPFTNVTQQLRFHYVENQLNLGCFRPSSIPRLIVCDRYLTELAVASVPYDQIIVIDNSEMYGGSGSPGMAVTYGGITGLAKEVAVHEFGHSFGGLNDEYNYGSTFTGEPPWPNCASEAKCKKWKENKIAECYLVCGFTNLYRPTFNGSLMRSLFPDNGYRFGPVSEEHLSSLLANYSGITSTDYDLDGDHDMIDITLLTSSYATYRNDEFIRAFTFNRLLQTL